AQARGRHHRLREGLLLHPGRSPKARQVRAQAGAHSDAGDRHGRGAHGLGEPGRGQALPQRGRPGQASDLPEGHREGKNPWRSARAGGQHHRFATDPLGRIQADTGRKTLQTYANPNLQQGASNATRSINILDYWKILRRGIWTIVAVFTIVVGLVALWTFTQVPVYRSVATVEVRTDVRKILPGQDSGGLGVNSFSWSAEERFYNTQIEILKSRDLADRVVKRMGLGADPMFQGTKSPGEILAAMVRAVPRTDTGIIEISLMGTKPQRITDITNVVAEEYKNRNIERARNSQRELIVDMGKQVEELSKSAQDAEKQKYTEGERSNLYVPDNQADVLGSSLRQLMDSNTKTKIEVGELDAVLRSIDAVK